MIYSSLFIWHGHDSYLYYSKTDLDQEIYEIYESNYEATREGAKLCRKAMQGYAERLCRKWLISRNDSHLIMWSLGYYSKVQGAIRWQVTQKNQREVLLLAGRQFRGWWPPKLQSVIYCFLYTQVEHYLQGSGGWVNNKAIKYVGRSSERSRNGSKTIP